MPWKATLILAVVVCSAGPSALAQNPAVTIDVDAALDRHPINPLIYGLNFADTATLNALNCTNNRYGGNRTSRYNWDQNVDHTGEFYYWESYPDADLPYGLPDDLVASTQNAAAEPLITVPMLSWIAKTDGSRDILCSFPQTTYPQQTDFSPDCAFNAFCCGNGISSVTGTPILNPDPNNASTPNSVAFQTTFVQHLANEGVHYYILDNEHGIWHETHRDVQPNGVSMDTIWATMRDYAAMIRGEDADARILGPEEFGWTGYFYSGADIQLCNQTSCWANPPDWDAHCGGLNEPPCDPIDYVGWLLDRFKAYDDANGTRLLDVFTLHFYPQGDLANHYEFSDDVSAATQLLRNRSTRSLWDPNYVNESWIGQAGPDGGKVRLIPRMKQWVAAHYPGTQIGITEYHWGATGHINGATSQADLLGIFGREGLDVANLYTDGPIGSASPLSRAFQMYRNYDGAKSTFGDTSVRATVPNPDNVSAFAATRASDGALTILVISKYLANDTPVTIDVSNFGHTGTAEVWRLNNDNTVTRLADVSLAGNAISDSLPRQTVTLYVCPLASADRIFSDGFEGGTLAAWSPASSTGGGDLRAQAEAALSGTGVGLRAVVDDTGALFVQDDTPSDEGRYRVRFYFDPNGFDPGEAQGHFRSRIFVAFDDSPVRRHVALVLRRVGGVFSLQTRVRVDDNSQVSTPFVEITDAPHFLELDWRRASTGASSDGSLEMWIDGVSVATLSGLDSSARGVDFVRLGPQSVKGGAAGTLYFDELDSRRQGYIGPL
jgi:Glycoside hydrolase family 44